MITDRNVTQLVRSWLHEDAHLDASHVLGNALEQVEATAQRRAGWLGPRFPTMQHMIRFGVAAVVIAGAAFFGYTMLNNVGADATRPSLLPVASPMAQESFDPGSTIPAALQHPFLGEPRSVIGMGSNLSVAQLVFNSRSFSFIGGVSDPYLSASGNPALTSTADLTADGLLRLTALHSEAVCSRGDVGLYEFEFSNDESILTIAPVDDACTARMEAITGEWQRSACRFYDNWCLGDVGAGSYSSQFFEPRPAGAQPPRFGAFQYEVPDGWANSEDYPGSYILMPQSEYATYEPDDCARTACPDAIALFAAPEPAPLDCSEPPKSTGEYSARDLRAWLESHPGLVVGSHPSSFGLPDGSATMYDVRVADHWTGTCDAQNPFVAAPLFVNPTRYHLALAPGDALKVIIVDLADESGSTPEAAPLLIIIDSRDAANLDRFAREALYVIGSFRFPPR